MEWLSSLQAWVALGSLVLLEIVLGIDNIIFIAVVTARLPEQEQRFAYRVGLLGAMGMRIALLLAINFIMGLTAPLFTVFGQPISGRAIAMSLGGLFLIGKSAQEIYESVEQPHGTHGAHRPQRSVWAAIAQIIVLDIIFSLDSVITAVGLAEDVRVMVAAIVIAIIVMLIFAKSVGDFVNRNRSVRVLALAMLMMIGVLLTAEAFGSHVPKGYVYFAMLFALTVELLNMRARTKSTES